MENTWFLLYKMYILSEANYHGYYSTGNGLLPFKGFPPRGEFDKIFNETKTELMEILNIT